MKILRRICDAVRWEYILPIYAIAVLVSMYFHWWIAAAVYAFNFLSFLVRFLVDRRILFSYMKDGGPESRVWGFFLIEIKKLFSIVLLHFKDGSREAYHSHAFHSISWVLKGELIEDRKGSLAVPIYRPSFRPVVTTRNNMHKVTSAGDTWVLSFRGPWAKTWQEYLPETGQIITLTHGRKEVPAHA